MSKAFLIGDIHLGQHSLTEDKWLDISESYFYDFFIPEILKQWSKDDMIFILGDLFDNRNYLTLKVISFALDLFSKFEELGLNILIISGNHDLRNNWDAEHTSLRILERYKNVNIVKDPTIYEFFNKKILLLPWNKHTEQLKEIKKWTGKIDYLFTHSDLRGAKTGIKNVLNTGNNIADYVGIPKVYASHIHIRQSIENFTFLGSPFHMDRNDKGNKKGITILDFEKNTEIFIENNISPQFRSVEILKEEDLSKIDTLLKSDDSDFIDVFINNNVVLNSKETKKKIEELSKKNGIANIKYIDNTEIDNGLNEIKLDDIGVNISTEDLIREFIKNQEIDNNTKEKWSLILDEMIRLCKSSNMVEYD